MSPFASFVSRKVLGVVALFAVLAASLVGFMVARGDGGSGSSTVGLSSSQAADAEVLGAALADPASVVDAAGPADPSGSNDGRQQLRSDLLAARTLTGDARRAALADIRAKALEGSYGPRVERRAERHQIRHQLLLDLLPDNLQADLTALKAAPADQRKQLRADIMAKALAGDYGADVQKAAKQLAALRNH